MFIGFKLSKIKEFRNYLGNIYFKANLPSCQFVFRRQKKFKIFCFQIKYIFWVFPKVFFIQYLNGLLNPVLFLCKCEIRAGMSDTYKIKSERCAELCVLAKKKFRAHFCHRSLRFWLWKLVKSNAIEGGKGEPKKNLSVHHVLCIHNDFIKVWLNLYILLISKLHLFSTLNLFCSYI